MHDPDQVERLFPFARRARILVVGRPRMLRMQGRLQFVLITEDLSANSQREIRRDFARVPIIQGYSTADIATHFGLHNTKVIGFQKSSLALSIYRELSARHANHAAPAADEPAVAPAVEPAVEASIEAAVEANEPPATAESAS